MCTLGSDLEIVEIHICDKGLHQNICTNKIHHIHSLCIPQTHACAAICCSLHFASTLLLIHFVRYLVSSEPMNTLVCGLANATVDMCDYNTVHNDIERSDILRLDSRIDNI